MGISALPQATVRTLGASQVLTDPSALVKELIDNSLDANATNISVEISINTIDVVQVRDNGHGVAPADRALLARRYCTSKISHDDDLKDIGGSSLGFRGEALASAAELSGSMTISTRIEGEQVAAALKISQSGEILGQENASLPVGTTVRITDFVKANPVRRQFVLKNTENCLKKIKRTLQSYAFARPHVRLSLRVLKAKNNKDGWIYAPKTNANAEDAACKVVGVPCANQCTWSAIEHSGFTLQAFLPRCDADASKIVNHGTFISVDHRPVSAVRGTFKQICKVYREKLKSSSLSFADVKDPFLFLEISCPPGSYDANLEPAKDDLLFEDSTIVVETAKKLFASFYDTSPPTHPETSLPAPGLSTESQSHTELTSPLEPHATASHPAPSRNRDGPAMLEPSRGSSMEDENLLDSRRKTRSNMYGCDEEDLDTMEVRPATGRTETDFEELREARKDVCMSNPWVMAKLNAPVGRQMPTPGTQGPAKRGFEETLSNMPSSPLKRMQGVLDEDVLPTPRPSSPAHPAEPFNPSDHVPQTRLAKDGRVVGSSILPPPQPYTTAQSEGHAVEGDIVSSVSRPVPLPYNYQPHAEPDYTAGTPLGAIPDISTRPRRSPRKQLQQGNMMRPFISPVIDQPPRQKVWFDHLENIERPRGHQRNRQQKRQDNSDLIVQGELGDLVEDPRQLTPPRQNRDIRDFVGHVREDSIASIIARRNYGQPARGERVSTQENEHPPESPQPPVQHPGFMPASELAALKERFGPLHLPEKRPTKRRRTSERRALEELSTNSPAPPPPADDAELETPETPDPPEDEEYRPNTSKRKLSRRKSSTRLGRTKSSRLPLESIPPGQGTHGLILPIHTDTRKMFQFAGKLDDELSFLSYNEPALPAPKDLDAMSSHLLALTANLHRLLVTAGGNTDVIGPAELLREVKASFVARDKEEEEKEDDDDEIMRLA